jgi:hypothetical protein
MTLHYFHPDEFVSHGRDWLPDISPSLLVRLDILRHQWGRRITVSPAFGAIGRVAAGSNSQHNIEKWGEVRAIDIMPAGIATMGNAHDFYLLCLDLGFTGIGFYPHWKPNPGFHLDVRQDRKPGDPATWGGVAGESGQVYVSINDAVEAFA